MLGGMNSDARIVALRYYHGSERNLQADIEALAANPQGVVVWLPRLVVLMKAADSKKPQQWGNLAESPANADGWYVHLLVGDMSLARRLAQEVPPHHWACFQRGMRSAAPHRLRWKRVVSRSHL